MGKQLAVLDDAQLAALLGDEDPAVGGDGHRGGAGESRRDLRLGEAGRQHREQLPPLQRLDQTEPARRPLNLPARGARRFYC